MEKCSQLSLVRMIQKGDGYNRIPITNGELFTTIHDVDDTERDGQYKIPMTKNAEWENN